MTWVSATFGMAGGLGVSQPSTEAMRTAKGQEELEARALPDRATRGSVATSRVPVALAFILLVLGPHPDPAATLLFLLGLLRVLKMLAFIVLTRFPLSFTISSHICQFTFYLFLQFFC